MADLTPGINRFHLSYADTSGVDDMQSSIGWVPAIGSDWLSWQTPSLESGPYLAVGQTTTLSFRTPPQPRGPGFGEVGLAGFPEWDAESQRYEVRVLPALRPIGIVAVPAKVAVVITDSAGVEIGTGGLKVAKWENAFDFTPAFDFKGNQIYDGRHEPLTTTLKGIDASGLDIIDRDADRFNVWVYDKGKWDAKTAHAQVNISTKNKIGFTQYDDPATPVDMVRFTGTGKGDGWYWSDSQMLVSNEVDDKASIPGVGGDENPPFGLGAPKNGYASGLQWYKSDRTHRVALRGDVTAEYFFDATLPFGKTATKPVPLRHFVDAHVNILNAPDPATKLESKIGVVTIGQANDDFTRANEQYAQVGILLIPHYGPNMAWPTKADPTKGVDVDLADGLDEFTGAIVAGKLVLTPEEITLLEPAAASPD